MAQWLGNVLDNVGTFLKLPEFGYSEREAGGKTSNTGSKAYGGSQTINVNGKTVANPNYVSFAAANKPAPNNNDGAQAGGNAASVAQPQGQQIESGYGSYAGSAAAAQAAQTAQERAAAASQWQQQLEYIGRQLGNLDGSFNSGMNQLGDNFNKGLSRLNEQQSNALTRYGVQRGDTMSDFNTSSNDIDNSARNNYQAIMSMLGRAGAGSSSASQVLTPYAVSNDASKTRGKVSETYGRNLRDLTNAEDETKQSYENNKRDLEDTKRNSEYGLRQGIDSQRASLYGKQAEAQGNLAQAKGGDFNAAKNAMGGALASRDSIERALSTLLDQYRNPYQVKDVAAKNVGLTNYAADTNGVKVEAGANATGDTDTAAATAAKLKAEEDKKKAALV